MITTVNELKVGDRISFINHDRRSSTMTILEMVLTSTRDFEWCNPWIPLEPPLLCYKMRMLVDGFPNNPLMHRYTANYTFYKHKDNSKKYNKTSLEEK